MDMMKRNDTISQREQTALDIMENPAAISDEQLRQLASDGQSLDLCRSLTEIADTGVQLPDVDAELAALHHRRHRRTAKRIGLAVFFAAAASVALLLLLRPTIQVEQAEQPNPLTVYKSEPQEDDHATLQIQHQARTLDTGAKAAKLPPSIASMSAHELVYAAADSHDALAKVGIIATHQVKIPRQETFRVVLSDGTEVFLNAGSRMIYPERFAGRERGVYLEGEAYFKVAKDSGHPFVVKSRDMQARVLGTEFDMRAYADEPTSVTLLEGSVAVGEASARTLRKITPGQRAQMGRQGEMDIREVDVAPCRYWKDGYFYFDKCSIEQIMKEIGRWYNVDVEFRRHRQSDMTLHFVGDRSKSLDYTLKLLNQMEKVKVSFKNGKLWID